MNNTNKLITLSLLMLLATIYYQKCSKLEELKEATADLLFPDD